MYLLIMKKEATTSVIRWDWSKDPGPTNGGELPRHFLFQECLMKELSVFIDESGVFGPYETHSPYYIVTLVFHDQSVDISENISHLNTRISQLGMPDYTIHAGPLIRREKEYDSLSLLERKRIFNALYNFVRTAAISYHAITVEKKHLTEEMDLNVQISKQLSTFLTKYSEMFSQFDRIVLYYDYGQMELTKILVSVFCALMKNVEIKKISPANYKLFQAADMLCTLELLEIKSTRKMLSKSELTFFSSAKNLKKAYTQAILKKKLK